MVSCEISSSSAGAPSSTSSSSAPHKPPLVVAVDLDEVLGEFVSQLCKFHNSSYGTSLTVEDFNSYHFSDVWGGTTEEATEKVYAFFRSPLFKTLLSLKKLGINLHLVTSRQHIIEDDTVRWIDRHYPGIFSELHFGNHYSSTGVVRSKSEICQSIGAKLLVDDSLRYAKECAGAGVEVVLFGDYAWNRTGDEEEALSARIQRARNWDEAAAIIQRLLEDHRLQVEGLDEVPQLLVG